MDQIATLLLGILLAALIFAATLFSAAQAYLRGGRVGRAHLVAAVSVVAAMAALGLSWWAASRVIGLFVLSGGVFALWQERGWNRLLPLVHIFFGMALVGGLPTGGG